MTEVVTLGECLVAFVATTPGPLAEATTFFTDALNEILADGQPVFP